MTIGRLLGGDDAGTGSARVAVLRATAAWRWRSAARAARREHAGRPRRCAVVGDRRVAGVPGGDERAADDPERAAARVSVVSSVGYTAFLAGPPLIGLLGEHAGILRALFVVVGALVLGLLRPARRVRCRPRRRPARRAEPGRPADPGNAG
jgi:hypothetical protein